MTLDLLWGDARSDNNKNLWKIHPDPVVLARYDNKEFSLGTASRRLCPLIHTADGICFHSLLTPVKWCPLWFCRPQLILDRNILQIWAESDHAKTKFQ